jgi:hypothetical protein
MAGGSLVAGFAFEDGLRMDCSDVLNKFRDLFPWPNRRCVEFLLLDRTSCHADVLIGRSFEKHFDYHLAILPQVGPVRRAFLWRFCEENNPEPTGFYTMIKLSNL